MKKLIASLAVVAVLAGAAPAGAAVGFQDVPVQSPYAKYVNDLQDKGIVVGFNGKFNPTDTLTRAEFATMAVKAFGLSLSSSTVKFADSRGHWGAQYIQSGVEAGIIAGTSSSTFEPDAQVKREEAAAIVWRWLIRKGVASKAVAGTGQDADEWAREAVQNMLGYGLHSVDVADAGAYRSLDAMNRQESAALFSTSLGVRPAPSRIVVNPTTNSNNIIDNSDGSKSFGNISMPDSYTAEQTADQAKYNLQLLGNVHFTYSGDQLTVTVPATNSEKIRWVLQDTRAQVWQGSAAHTETFADVIGVGVSLYDYETGRAYGRVTVLHKDGNWKVTYPTE